MVEVINISDDQFTAIVDEAIASMPKKYLEAMSNVAFVIEDEPSQQQRQKMKLRDGHTLLGLYEGIPLPERNAGYNLVLPDKITIFKKPSMRGAQHINQLKEQVRKTVWHEIAHHFGLEHEQIHKLGG